MFKRPKELRNTRKAKNNPHKHSKTKSSRQLPEGKAHPAGVNGDGLPSKTQTTESSAPASSLLHQTGNGPRLIFAGEKAPVSIATTKDESLNEGYLHSLIDQLHQLVSQLRTERSFLETALKHMPCGVVIADAPSGRLRGPNKMVDEIMRERFFPAKSIQDYSHWKGFHPDGRAYEPHEWPMARAIKYGEEIRGEEIRVLRGDGTYGYIEVNAAPICNDKRQIVAGIVAFSDITERRAAGKGIRENVERLRLAQTATGIGFWERDLATEKLIWSEETFRLYGQDPASFKPTTESFIQCVHEADRDRVRAHMKMMVAYRKESRLEFRVQWPDESMHWVEERCRPFLFNGDPVRIFGVTIDISERKRFAGLRPQRRKAKAATG